MHYKVFIMRIEPSLIPTQPGSAAALDLDDNLHAALGGWTVVSHTVSQQLTGEMLLTIFCQRP